MHRWIMRRETLPFTGLVDAMHHIAAILSLYLMTILSTQALAQSVENWSPPEHIPFFSDSCVALLCPTLNQAMDTMFFERDSKIYYTVRSDSMWGAPILFPPLADVYLSERPSLAANGKHLYFSSYNVSSWDLYACARDERTGAWGPPQWLGDTINNPSSHEQFCFEASDSVLLVQRDTDGVSIIERSIWDSNSHRWGPLREITPDAPGYEICMPKRVTGLISGFSLTKNRDRIYMSLEVYVGTKLDYQLYVCTYDTQTHRYCNPIPLSINTVIGSGVGTGREEDPWISPDGQWLYFDSNRDGPCGWSKFYRSRLIADGVKVQEEGGVGAAGPSVSSAGIISVSPRIDKSGLDVLFHTEGDCHADFTIVASSGDIVGRNSGSVSSANVGRVFLPCGKLPSGSYEIEMVTVSQRYHCRFHIVN